MKTMKLIVCAALAMATSAMSQPLFVAAGSKGEKVVADDFLNALGATETGKNILTMSAPGNNYVMAWDGTGVLTPVLYSTSGAPLAIPRMNDNGTLHLENADYDAIRGNSTNGYGVYGISNTNAGVYGESSTTQGVYGTSYYGEGVIGNSANYIGVVGYSSDGVGLLAVSNAGSHHAKFGNNGDNILNIERLGGLLQWTRDSVGSSGGPFSCTLGPVDLTDNRSWILPDRNGTIALDSTALMLSGGAMGGNIDMQNYSLLNVDFIGDSIAGVQAIIVGDRHLLDVDGLGSVAWSSRYLVDDAGTNSIEWQNRRMMDSTESPSIDWENKQMIDTLAVASVEWENRKLNNPSDVEVFNWNGAQATLTKGAKFEPSTIANLPTASEGSVNYVNNALSPVIGATVVAGGSAKCLVCYNGTVWKVIAIL